MKSIIRFIKKLLVAPIVLGNFTITLLVWFCPTKFLSELTDDLWANSAKLMDWALK